MRKYFFNSNIGSVMTMVSICLMAAASLSAQTASGDPRPRPTNTAAPRPSMNHAEPRNSSRSRAAARDRAWRIRQAEEAAAEEARARQVRADEERREKEQVWQISIINNETKNPIAYRTKCGNSWQETIIKPGGGWMYTRRNEAVIVRFESGGETKEYSMQALKVVGHKPTESDEKEAWSKANYFRPDANGNIELYAKR